MAPDAIFTHLLRRSVASGSRSTAVTPLGWLIATEFLGLGVCLKYGAPGWLLLGVGVALAVTVVAYLGSYFYFMVTNPDALRSERFSLAKTAIEKSVQGDNLAGLIEAASLGDELLLPETASTPATGEKPQ